MSALGFLTSIVMVRALTVDDFGHYRTIGALLFVLPLFVSLGLNQALVRYGSELLSRHQNRGYVRLAVRFFAIRTIVLLVVLAGLYLSSDFWLHLYGVPNGLLAWFPAVLIWAGMTCSSPFFDSMLAAQFQNTVLSLGRVISGIVALAGAYLTWKYNWGLAGIITSTALSESISVLISFFFIYLWYRRSGRHQEGETQLKPAQIRRFAFFSFAAQCTGVIRDTNIDILMIGTFLTPRNVAVYGVAASLGAILSRFNPSAVLRSIVLPVIVDRFVRTKDLREVELVQTLVTKLGLIVMVPGSILLGLLGEKLLSVVYGPDYTASYLPMMVLVTYYTLRGMVYPIAQTLDVLEKNQVHALSVWTSMLNIGLALVLIPKLGLVGAALSTLISGLAHYLHYVWYGAKIGNLRIDPCIDTILKLILLCTPGSIALYFLRDGAESLWMLAGLGVFAVATFSAGIRFFGLFSPKEKDMLRSTALAKWV